MFDTLLLLPSLTCPANCVYCFGPHQGSSLMGQDILQAITCWQVILDDQDPLEIVFHGGEPLVAGFQFYRMALPLLQRALLPRKVSFSIQSNLWLLTDELCDLFVEYDVSIGTSLDGPEEINDAQRGSGYFARTMRGVECARKHGIKPGCICTFTSWSATHNEEILHWFVREGLSFSIHAASQPIQACEVSKWVFLPDAYGHFLVDMLNKYLPYIEKVRIRTLDSIIRGIAANKGESCLFTDCLGKYVAIAPDGSLYPCQRFAGLRQYSLGNILDYPTEKELSATYVWQILQDRQESIEEMCGDCPNIDFCRGGCAYNALAVKGDRLDSNLRDPYCAAYQCIFDYVVDRAVAEVFSNENLSVLVDRTTTFTGLLQHGALLSIMQGIPRH